MVKSVQTASKMEFLDHKENDKAARNRDGRKVKKTLKNKMKRRSTDQESELAGKLKSVHKHGKKHSVLVNEEMELLDAVGANNSAGSVKKLHKNKRKKHPSANEETELLPKGGESKRDNIDQVSTGEGKSPGGTKGSVKKLHKNKRKKHASANEETELSPKGGESKRNNIDQVSTGEGKSRGGTKGSVKKLHKNKRKKHDSANEETELLPKGGESKRDNNDQVSTGEGKSPGGTKNKLKKALKSKRKDQSLSEDKNKSGKKGDEPYEIYQISSGEEDCSKGMKKWVEEYYTNRVGLDVLQQRIDDIITEHEEQEEQARKDKEAKIAEDGWTVVVHRKGGKKTNDPESGVSVGSVSQGAVLHKMDKKRSKEVGSDFYRFQRREAQQSAVMKNRSLFEEDRKRIQQLRAARKFKPY